MSQLDGLISCKNGAADNLRLNEQPKSRAKLIELSELSLFTWNAQQVFGLACRA